MKKLIWIIAAVFIVALVIFKLASNKKNSENRVYQYDKEKPITVSVDTVGLQTIDYVNTYTGTFEPNRETKVSADIQGRIDAVFVDVGSILSKGQALIQLDNSLLRLQLQTIELQIEGLENDVQRYAILTEADAAQGVQLEKAKLGLKSARIQKATLVEQINKTTIKSPFNGVVTAKLNEEGGFAAPGIPLLQITDINTLRFTVNVPEHDLPQFQSHKTYKISVDAYPDISLSGKVIMIGSKANIGNSFPVQFHVANTKNLRIKSGMFGKADLLDTVKQTQGVLVPFSSILEEKGIAKVYLIKNRKAVLKPIVTSRSIGNKVVVSSGLTSGDIVVTNGFINLFDGANITIKQ